MIDIARSDLEVGVPAFEVFRRAGLAGSNREARNLIRGGGARVNDSVVPSETLNIDVGDINADGVVKLSAGKKRHALVRPS